ncbi:flagellar basal body P-ring formation chaperone FlgA [Legionella spiritensis]|uniref:Flagella basal body P-ring formation protein FlgA n=1 Tax=Legionella spiritensis TaxID=452 RepID=A0A0W0Z6P8_LEGSP|nr:flagellar basal body P-ring formation chaperone FlgA [Legionella spiritensis]KTD64807.1 flagellar basal body P-ring biosynthesis protein FlgA [Legionella spiritensis]SNV40342.1 flagella basal body P-ring formation protein FlgA [Legionella spiritensis]
MLQRLLFTTLLFFTMSGLQARTVQSLIVLKDRVEQHLLNKLAGQYEGTIKVTADTPDPRLQLKQCADDKLQIFNPYQTALLGSTTIGVRCQEPDNHWTLYIPTRITIEKPVVVAKNNLLKGEVIKKDDLHLVPMDISLLKLGYFTDPGQVAGQIAKQAVNQGSYLMPSTLEAARIIRKGQEVRILAISNNLKVSMKGIALSDGAQDELIKVKNLSSKRIIEGRVSNKNEVHITL